MKTPEKYRFCWECKGWRKKSEFGEHIRGVDGLRRYCKTCMVLQSKSFLKERPGLASAQTSKYRALKLQRTPKWLSKAQYKEILGFYSRCRKISDRTGVKHEVDHIVPLRGKRVCGLHVPWNLQIITKAENAKKGNRYNEDT